MPNLKYAETVTLPGVSIASGVMGVVAAHVASRGYSLSDLGEVYLRQQQGGVHLNYKVYEHDGKEADKIPNSGDAV